MPRAENPTFSVVVTSDSSRAVMLSLRELERGARDELTDANERISADLAGRLRRAGMVQGRQAALVATTVKAKRGQRPSVDVGGSAPVGRHHVPAGALLIGSEFGHSGKGGRGRGSKDFAPHGFRPRRSSGYWWYPTLERERPSISADWQAVADDLVKRWGSK